MTRIRITPRQREVLEFVLRGMSSPEIARVLHRSVRTIESHRLELGRKLGARNSTELIRKAIEHGLVDANAADRQLHADAQFSDQLMTTLRSLDAAVTSATSGESLLNNLCAQMGAAFGVSAVIICRRTDQSRIRLVASWTDPIQPFDIDWCFSRCLCSRLSNAEIATVRYHDLPDEMRNDLAPILGDDGWFTVVPLHENRVKHLGMIGLIHRDPLDPALCPHSLLRFSGMWVVAELLYSKYSAELRALGFQLSMIEQCSGAASFRFDTDGQLIWHSAHLLEVFLSDAQTKPRCLHDILTLLVRDYEARHRQYIEEQLAGRACFALRLPAASPGPDAGDIAIQCHPIHSADGHACEYFGMARRLPGGAEGQRSNEALACDRLGKACPTSQAATAWSEGSCSKDRVPIDFSDIRGCKPGPVDVRGLTDQRNPLIDGSTTNQVPSSSLADRDPEEWLTAPHQRALKHPSKPVPERAVGDQQASDRADDSSSASAETIRSITLDWMFANSPNAMCIASLDGWIKRANPAMCAALEATEQELCAKPFYNLFEDDDHDHVTEILKTIADGQPIERVVLPIRTLRGNRVLIDWSCPPVLPGTNLFTPIGKVL